MNFRTFPTCTQAYIYTYLQCHLSIPDGEEFLISYPSRGAHWSLKMHSVAATIPRKCSMVWRASTSALRSAKRAFRGALLQRTESRFFSNIRHNRTIVGCQINNRSPNAFLVHLLLKMTFGCNLLRLQRSKSISGLFIAFRNDVAMARVAVPTHGTLEYVCVKTKISTQ